LSAADLQSSTSEDQNYTTSHVVIVSTFEPGSIYRVQAQSTDASGTTRNSETYSLLTPRSQESIIDVILKNFQEVFGYIGN
jgi:hypothetical protein